MKSGYRRTVDLKHTESLHKVDNDTGEMTEIKQRPNNIPDGSEKWMSDAVFKKSYTNSWAFLDRQLKPIEFKAAYKLAMMAKANTNSLEPLSDDTMLSELMRLMQVSKNMVQPILKKLFELGVYGRFEAKQVDKPYTKYWILNPHLAFSGQLIKSDIAELFRNTHVARAFYDAEYGTLKMK